MLLSRKARRVVLGPFAGIRVTGFCSGEGVRGFLLQLDEGCVRPALTSGHLYFYSTFLTKLRAHQAPRIRQYVRRRIVGAHGYAPLPATKLHPGGVGVACPTQAIVSGHGEGSPSSFYISTAVATVGRLNRGARASSPHLASEQAGWKPALPGNVETPEGTASRPPTSIVPSG